MNILVVGHSLGNLRQMAMWKWIADQGHKVTTVIFPQYREEIYKPIKEGSFQQILMPPYSTDVRNFWTLPGLHDLAYKLNPDVIFCVQEPWEYITYDVMNIAKMLNIKFGLFTWENIMKAFPSPWRKIESEVIRGADFIIGGNKDACDILLKKGANIVIKEIQTGLDPSLFTPEPKLSFSERVEPIKLLCVGRLTEGKGIKTILQTFDKLPKNYVLRFVGGRGELEGLITSHPEFNKRITLEPWMEYTQMPRVYNWADILLMPSIDTPMWIEQFGYAIGEALLCETPVITTFSKSIMESWKFAGTAYMMQGDVDTLEQLVVDDWWKDTVKQGKLGRKMVIDNYSIEKIGSRYIKILEETK